MPHKADKSHVQKLAAEVFDMVQGAQGRGFVCDGLGDLDEEFFWRTVRGHLFWSRRSVDQLEAFLRKHNQPIP